MPIDYRSELRRPFSLVLAGAAILGWLVALSVWLSYSSRLGTSRAEATRLQQAEVAARTQLEEQLRATGTVADLQSRAAAAQRELAQLNQSREQTQAQLAVLQQTLQTTQQQLTQVQNQLPQAEQRLAAAREEIATG
jgi:chromosome segregation ATPase